MEQTETGTFFTAAITDEPGKELGYRKGEEQLAQGADGWQWQRFSEVVAYPEPIFPSEQDAERFLRDTDDLRDVDQAGAAVFISPENKLRWLVGSAS